MRFIKGVFGFEVFLSLILLALPASSVANIAVQKTFSTYDLTDGESITVTISVANYGDEDLLGAALIDSVPPYLPVSGETKQGNFSQVKRFDGIRLKLRENATFTYKLSAKNVPPALRGRDFIITPAIVKDQYGNLHYSNPTTIRFVGENKRCNFNLKCEPQGGENFITCPQDCYSGSADGYCDQKLDGRCDPDCQTGSDVDCLVQTSGECGNGLCERYESPASCPADCGPQKQATSTTLKGISAAVQKVGYTNLLLYLAGLLFLAVAAAFLYAAQKKQASQAKTRLEASEEEAVKEIMGRLREGADPKKLVEEGYNQRLVETAKKQIWK